MRAGEDIPPVFRLKGKMFDGRHRAHAARTLRLPLAPTIHLETVAK